MTMMSLTYHDTASVTARAETGGRSEWIELTLTSGNGEVNELSVFFREPGKAEKFAAAINLVDAEEAVRAETRKIIAEIRENPRPASHTDAFADNDQQDYLDEKQFGWSV